MTAGWKLKIYKNTKSHKKGLDIQLIDMYLYADSKASVYHPLNTAADFTVQLPTSISAVSECGLIEVRLPSIPPEKVFACIDICEGSIVNDKTLPVIRSLIRKDSAPTHIIYIPLRIRSFDTIRFYICDQSGQVVELIGETSVTLHLR